jgi:hypothetical protein
MSEPSFQPSAIAAERQDSLWNRAPSWRNLIVLASFLTVAAAAAPLLLPQPVDTPLSSQVVPSHIATARIPNTMATHPVDLAPGQAASLAHQTTTEAISRPVAPVEQHAAAPKLNTASLAPQPEQAAGRPAQPTANALNMTAPPADLSNLPVGTEIITSGELTRVDRHNRYNPSLGGDLPISITIISQPTHGTISTQEGTAQLTFPNAGITRMSSVTNVFYQSNPGYAGQDSFTYKRTSSDPNDPKNSNTYTVSIYVKPAVSAQHAADAQAAPQ